MKKRVTQFTNLSIHLPNQFQQPQSGSDKTPVILTSVAAVYEDDKLVTHPTQTPLPMIAEDVTPELLESLRGAFATIGLGVERLEQPE